MSASDLQESGRRLLGSGDGFKPLAPAARIGARPGEVATGRPSSAANAAPGSLIETDYAERLYWSAVQIQSTDGLLVLEVEPIREVKCEGDRVMSFKQPA